MTVLADLKDRLASAAREQGARYAAGSDRPLRGYVITMGTYASLVGAIAGGIKVTGKKEVPDGLPLTDIALSAAATHKLSRLLARDPVTSPLRAPFTSYRGTAGPAELAEDVRGGRPQDCRGACDMPVLHGHMDRDGPDRGADLRAAHHEAGDCHPRGAGGGGPAAVRALPAREGHVMMTWHLARW